jgi:hypothetical protein
MLRLPECLARTNPPPGGVPIPSPSSEAARYSHDSDFVVLGKNRGVVVAMEAGSIDVHAYRNKAPKCAH